MGKHYLRTVLVITGLALLGVAILIPLASATVPGTNQIVSMNYSGTGPANNHSSWAALISANGKYVFFNSSATNIVSSGGSGSFLRNLANNATVRTNISTSG